jgi:uncharacterized protein
MRILVDIGHPGHVHFYKHAIWQWQKEGHEVFISARAKDVTIELLEHYGFRYAILSQIRNGQIGMLQEFIQREWALFRLIRQFNPDIVTEIGGLFIAPVCWLLRKPALAFTDSEPVPLDKFFTYPFATKIYTPDCFMRDLGNKQVRYAGYHELAYLHPKYFTPDPSVLDELGVQPGEPYSVLRFVAWKATHDIGQSGFSPELKQRIVKTLGSYGRVFITSETPLSPELEPYRIMVPPHRIHDILYYARLFMGDGATMATEAGILGTPSVRASSMALNMGNFVELMERYKLVYSYYNAEGALAEAIRLLSTPTAKQEWVTRREHLLADKIDVTNFIYETIRNSGDNINPSR